MNVAECEAARGHLGRRREIEQAFRRARQESGAPCRSSERDCHPHIRGSAPRLRRAHRALRVLARVPAPPVGCRAEWEVMSPCAEHCGRTAPALTGMFSFGVARRTLALALQRARRELPDDSRSEDPEH